MSGHPTGEVLDSYRRNDLRGPELLRIDDHIAQCAVCRSRIAISPSSAAAAWDTSFSADHLTYDELEAFVDGTLERDPRAGVVAHTASCRECADALDDLRLFRGRKRFGTLGAVAAAAIVVIVSGILLWRPQDDDSPIVVTNTVTNTIVRPAPPPAPVRVIRDAGSAFLLEADGGVRGLSPVDAETLRQLRAGIVSSAAIFADIGRGRDVLRGDDLPSNHLRVETPRGVVVDDRPEFRWSDPQPGATYRVSVVDGSYRVVARSNELTSQTWRPATPLARDLTYEWQVKRRMGDSITSAPAPPAPSARFRIVSKSGAAEIRKAQLANSHLLLALAYARAGMLHEAKAAVDALRALNPESPVVRELQSTLSLTIRGRRA
jgi:hypothetical protein